MLTDFNKIALKLSGVLTVELQVLQEVVAPDQVVLLLELEESSELSEQLCVINRKVSARTKGVIIFKLVLFKRLSKNFFIK
tara:strand:+ start:71 stop:313 length:243 start_codon:yes stop_codon:yes gene_type:complete